MLDLHCHGPRAFASDMNFFVNDLHSDGWRAWATEIADMEKNIVGLGVLDETKAFFCIPAVDGALCLHGRFLEIKRV